MPAEPALADETSSPKWPAATVCNGPEEQPEQGQQKAVSRQQGWPTENGVSRAMPRRHRRAGAEFAGKKTAREGHRQERDTPSKQPAAASAARTAIRTSNKRNNRRWARSARFSVSGQPTSPARLGGTAEHSQQLRTPYAQRGAQHSQGERRSTGRNPVALSELCRAVFEQVQNSRCFSKARRSKITPRKTTRRLLAARSIGATTSGSGFALSGSPPGTSAILKFMTRRQALSLPLAALASKKLPAKPGMASRALPPPFAAKPSGCLHALLNVARAAGLRRPWSMGRRRTMTTSRFDGVRRAFLDYTTMMAGYRPRLHRRWQSTPAEA